MMSRHVGAIRILSLELLGFKNLLSFASHQSLRIPTNTLSQAQEFTLHKVETAMTVITFER